MDHDIAPPIDQFRRQGTPITDETLPNRLRSLIQGYEAFRYGYITDPKMIRQIAREFEALADTPEAERFPYNVGRVAVTLYNRALEIDASFGNTIDIAEYLKRTAQETSTEPITSEFGTTTEGLERGTVPQRSNRASKYNQWTGILKLIEIAENEAKERDAKGIVKGSNDPNDLWDEEE